MLFIIGYLSYAAAFWNSRLNLLDLIVPGICIFGAYFIWLTAKLSLLTAVDVLRVGLLELETVVDPLTGVFNRLYLDHRLNKEVTAARIHSRPLSLLFLDIDYFKQVCYRTDTGGVPA